jgi:fucose 4-O-acetylase-like acetyltransferase
MNKRSYVLDEVKGIGIILVVLYHALGKVNPDIFVNYDNWLFNMIACFFMQMFMIISGYLAYGKVKDINWIGRIVARWILPILSFTVIYWLWAKIFPDMIKFDYGSIPIWDYILFAVTSGFANLVTWYLWCLMLCYFIIYSIEQIANKYQKVPLIAVILIMVVMINLIPINIFGMYTLKWYGIFFFIGYLLNHYQSSRIIKIGSKLVYASLGIFPLCGYLFNWMIPYQNNDYGIIGLAAIIPALLNGQGLLICVMVLMALLGSSFVYSIAKINRNRWGICVLSYLGKISVGIYLLHIMFVGITNNWVLSSVLALGISIILYEILKRIKGLNIIVGVRSETNQ